MSVDITLHPWTQDDLPILYETLGNPEMMEHLGGVETPEQIRARHERFLTHDHRSHMFTVRVERGNIVAGTIGFWEREWRGDSVYETGWMVLSRYAGRGIASAAARAVIEKAKAEGRCRSIHAYPSVDNAASNGVCRKAGFKNLGEFTFEYPKGHFIQCYDWCVDLSEAPDYRVRRARDASKRI